MATVITEKELQSFSLRQRELERRRIAKAAMVAIIKANTDSRSETIVRKAIDLADALQTELDKVASK